MTQTLALANTRTRNQHPKRKVIDSVRRIRPMVQKGVFKVGELAGGGYFLFGGSTLHSMWTGRRKVRYETRVCFSAT